MKQSIVFGILLCSLSVAAQRQTAPYNYITNDVKAFYALIDSVRQDPALFASRWHNSHLSEYEPIEKMERVYPGVVNGTKILLTLEKNGSYPSGGYSLMSWGIGKSIEEVVRDLFSCSYTCKYLMTEYYFQALSIMELKKYPGWYKASLIVGKSGNSFYNR